MAQRISIQAGVLTLRLSRRPQPKAAAAPKRGSGPGAAAGEGPPTGVKTSELLEALLKSRLKILRPLGSGSNKLGTKIVLISEIEFLNTIDVAYINSCHYTSRHVKSISCNIIWIGEAAPPPRWRIRSRGDCNCKSTLLVGSVVNQPTDNSSDRCRAGWISTSRKSEVEAERRCSSRLKTGGQQPSSNSSAAEHSRCACRACKPCLPLI